MEDRKTLAYDWIKSILPGGNAQTNPLDTNGQVSGTFCLLMYNTNEQGQQCIGKSHLFKIDVDNPPQCISVPDGYESISFERTYNHYVSDCP
jgi:hypothetical protein